MPELEIAPGSTGVVLLTADGREVALRLRVSLESALEGALRYWSGAPHPHGSLLTVMDVGELVERIVRDLKAADATRDLEEGPLSEEDDALLFLTVEDVERVLRQHLEPGSAGAE